MRTERRHSYGIIPVFKGERGFEVLAVLQDRLGKIYWSFAKGTPEGSETPLETAVRETKEEVGITFNKIDRKTTFIEQYEFEEDGVTYEKLVTFFVGFTNDRSFTPEPGEVEDAKWVPLDQAEAKLTFPESKKVARQLHEHLNPSLDFSVRNG